MPDRPGTLIRKIIVLTTSLISLVGGSASGQTPDSLPFGQYVRVTDGGAWQYGTLEHAVGDSLILRGRISRAGGDDRMALSLSSMHRMQTRTGRRGHAFTGFQIGAAIGVVGGALSGLLLCHAFAGFVPCDDPGGEAFRGGLSGGAIMGGLGALIGWAIRTDRWEEVPLDQLRVSVVPQQSGRFSLGLSVGF